jgi:hypothetical protein
MGLRFESPITLQGVESGDHRLFHQFDFRQFPLAYRWAPQDFGAHQGAMSVGIFHGVREGTDADKARFGYDGPGTLWIGDLEYLDDVPEAAQAQLRAEKGVGFFSVDPGGPLDYRYVIIDSDGNEVGYDEIDQAQMLIWMDKDEDGKAREWLQSLRERIEFDLYTVGGVTQVDIACFHECRANLDGAQAVGADTGERQAASGQERDNTPEDTQRARQLLRRIAAGPATRPAKWYAKASYDRYTPWSITDEGEFTGHLAGWNACHRGFANTCERPDYQTEFDEFHTGWVALDDGTRLRVGVVTHVEGHLNTAAEYDRVASDPLCQLGSVRLYADKYGIQIRGGVHPDVTPETIARALASAPSGDWRGPQGARRLYGIALVNTPGYTAYVQEDGADFRMVAAIPSPAPNGQLDVTQAFFEAPTSVLTAACACRGTEGEAETAAESAHAEHEHEHGSGGDCGCGGTCGGCGTAQQAGLSPDELLTVATLDKAFSLVK